MCETVYDFLLANRRLPRIGDDVPPWAYKGWLLPYIQGHEAELCGRWPYYLETVWSGQLPDKAIPKLKFTEIVNQKSPGFKVEHYGETVKPVFLNSGQGLLFGAPEDFPRR